MRLYFFGPRIFGIRTGVSFGPKDFRGKSQSRTYTYQTDTVNSRPAFVYVTRGDHGRCKIGITNNPNSRLLQLSTASAFPLSFAYIGVTKSGDGSNVEREAHAILDRYRVNGEWFDCPPELAIAAVNGAAARIGESICLVDPSRVDELFARVIATKQPWRPYIPFWRWFFFVAFLIFIYLKFYKPT